MNLSDKTVTIESLAVISYPPESSVKVNVSEEILPGVFKSVGQYVFKFEVIFSGFDDPNLLSLVNNMLEQVP